MVDQQPEKENEIVLTDEEIEILAKKKISDYVEVYIDADKDVTIIDKFMGETRSVLPMDEAFAVAKFIVKFFEENAESTDSKSADS